MHPTQCSVITRAGKDCGAVAVPDSPVPLCGTHLREAYTFVVGVRESLTDGSLKFPGADLPPWLPEPKPDTCVVYYLGFADRVKIGTTRNLSKRLTQLPHDELLAVEPGDARLERVRHQQFVRSHIDREWFARTPDLLDHIGMLRQHYGEP